MKKMILAILVALVAVELSGVAFEDPSPNGPGQPGAPGTTCGSPGAENSPPGFNTAGFANAGAHYAGSPGTPSLENANSPHTISQYDIACYQVTQHGLFPPERAPHDTVMIPNSPFFICELLQRRACPLNITFQKCSS